MAPEQDAPAAAGHAVTVLLDDALVTLNRAVGLLRRRQVPVEGLVVSPSGAAGLSRLTFVTTGDAAAVARMAQQVGKIVGVRDVLVASPGSPSSPSEVAL